MAVTIRENDSKAAKLLLLSWGLSVVAQMLYPPKLDSTVLLTQITFYGALVLPLFVFIALVAGIWAGYRWVKVVYVILLVVAVINVVRHGAAFLHEPADHLVFTISILALRIWAMVIIVKDLLMQQPEHPMVPDSPDAGAAQGQ